MAKAKKNGGAREKSAASAAGASKRASPRAEMTRSDPTPREGAPPGSAGGQGHTPGTEYGGPHAGGLSAADLAGGGAGGDIDRPDITGNGSLDDVTRYNSADDQARRDEGEADARSADG
jgi:hypothetical protein